MPGSGRWTFSTSTCNSTWTVRSNSWWQKHILGIRTGGILLILILSLTGSSSMAQPAERAVNGVSPDTIALNDITVSTLPFGESAFESTGGFYVLSRDRIRQGASSGIAGLMNTVPGIYMASGSENTNRLVIRGIGSRTPYSTNRIRAYLNQIPLTSGDGVSTIEDIDLSSIGRVEILKGPSSALYGSGLGGVVRFNSVYPSEASSGLELYSEFGSFASLSTSLTAWKKGGNAAINAGISHTSAQGFRENSRYARSNLFFSARFFGQKNSAELTFHVVDLHARIPSSLDEQDFLNDPEKAGGSWGDIGGYESTVRVLGGITLESHLSRNVHNYLTGFSTFSDPYERRPFNTLDEQAVNAGFRETLEYRQHRMNFRTGFEYFREWYQWQIYETLSRSHGQLESDMHEVRQYLNGFTLFQWRPGKMVLVDAALNLHILDYRLEKRFPVDPQGVDDRQFRYRPVLSPRIGISLSHSHTICTYATAGHGFSAPSLEETLLPEGQVNTSLKPETGWNLELGNRGKLLHGCLLYEVSAYTVFLRNLLVTKRLSEDLFTGVNAGKALNTGIEIWLKAQLFTSKSPHRFNAGITSGGNLSRNIFTDFTDNGHPFSGNRLPGIPSPVWNTSLTGKFREARVVFTHLYTGRQWMTDANDRIYGASHVFHIRISWGHPWGTSPFTIRIFGAVRNIFNTRYASMILINAPSFGDTAPRYYYPGNPRQFTAGIRITLM